ncbi:MAG: hypothetical protein U1E08_07875 [Coriobacteriia bacterium]|nr:hypothetical protein [Coriobacteriia bacterium]
MTRSRVHVRMVVTLLAVMLAIGGVTAAPVYAAETYTGGAIDAPQYILNDHTAVGFRWGAQAETTGLEASTSYYVKVRFTMTPSPSPTTNRGFTWNAAKQRWAQESEAWAEFPTVATDADGKIAARWVYAKFGDENSKGSYYVQVSLQKVGGGSTFNSSAPLQSMILDAATEGGWIHNGITLADVNARVAVRDADATTDLDDDPSLPYALGKTEVNTLDDDGDGTADNEDYGPTGSAGDFRMGVPADTGVTIFTKRVLRFGGVVTSPAADCDMAAGADDVGAPARVTGLAAEPAGETASGHVELAWDEATDSGDSGLAGYLVYRWEPTQTVNPKYTPAPMLIGQTNAGQTTFTDETAIDGTEYAYHVRAIDVATNVGPRSNTATVLPDGALP